MHSNGFSLTRKVFDIDTDKNIIEQPFDEIEGSLGEELLKPTKIYVKSILNLLEKINIKSICHITGGGFQENIPRAFGDTVGALIKKDAIQIPAIFKIIEKAGKIPERDMFNTYNMGVGMCVIASPQDADSAVNCLKESGETAYIIGEIREGVAGVVFE